MRERSASGAGFGLRSRALTLAGASLLVVALAGAAPSVVPASGPAPGSRAREGAASESKLVSETALAVLARGGTAVDAAVAAVFAAGVVTPTSSGLGGGGVALVYRAGEHSVTAVDFRETAPAVLDEGAYERRPLPDEERGKLAGVPGEVRGLAWLHQHFGKKPWRELVAPAERLARDGFALEAHMASVIGSKDEARYRRMPSIERAFYAGGKAAVLGQRVKRPELAKTLRTLGAQGPEALYTGALAGDVVAALRKYGSTLTRDDLAHYEVRSRTPLRVTWEGYEVATMPPPSAGGLFLAEVLGTFTRAELDKVGLTTPLGMHLMAEAMRGALADRSRFVGDPDVLPIDMSRVLAPARLAARKARFAPERTQPVKALASEEHGTHALVVADAAGNVVSLTTTVNTAFGCEVAAEQTGIVLNDQLDDFTSRAAATAVGVAFPPNIARPGRRPTSSMMPTIVLAGGSPVVAIAGSGGFAIPPSVTETLLAILVRGESPDAAVRAPRFRFDSKDYTLLLDSAFGDAARDELLRRGETVRVTEATSAVQVLTFGAAGVVGAADPRKGGTALVR
ncbi:MAG TPA: gamma-glutamyltransferase [Polyangiaceae bacterium]|nr:gamma-glutamyltransferase [Polyangiaceae bacterium]